MTAQIIENKKINNKHFSDAIEATFNKYNSWKAEKAIKKGKKPKDIKSKKPQYISTIEALFTTFILKPDSHIYRPTNNRQKPYTNKYSVTRYPNIEKTILAFLEDLEVINQDSAPSYKYRTVGVSNSSTFSLTQKGKTTISRLAKKVNPENIKTAYSFHDDPIIMREKCGHNAGGICTKCTNRSICTNKQPIKPKGKSYLCYDFKKRPTFLNNSVLVEEVKTMGKQVNSYNSALSGHTVLCNDKHGLQVDVTSKLKLQRIFNSNPNFKKGGRFYSSQTNIGKALRPSYIIDGSKTVELDYSCMFISMLYHHLKIDISGREDLYKIDGYGDEFRLTIKIITNAILNIKSASGAISSMLAKMDLYDKEIEAGKIPDVDKFDGLQYPIGMDTDSKKKLIKDAIQHLKSSEISEFVFHKVTDKNGKVTNEPIGLFLMYRESYIASRIIADFQAMSEICIPVHDSYIVRKGLEGELRESMTKNYHDVWKTYPMNIK
ncbi:MAG: hypothetical protein JKY62_14800 [Desulfocapsa sp.]|uniref:DNA-directed DNA polymerase n=1 Tax=Desulfotalea psychrophila TaxID=84980 RepID=A0ABS3AV54_9BACT|nr:hypothetical protein [Desulfocapsa sp.]MBN4048916.1 hypothetical protein [bacterium AH-315-N22]MBN4068990.1 hypothetical protein [Desulfotalea psychrophila]